MIFETVRRLTNDIRRIPLLAVDGATRYLSVYHDRDLLFHG